MTDESLVDAGLGGVVLVGVLGAGFAVDARVVPAGAAAGGGATLLAEALLGRYEAAVREWWRRPGTKAAAILLAAAAVGSGAVLAADPALSFGAGAATTYVALVGLVRSGAVPPPRAWT